MNKYFNKKKSEYDFVFGKRKLNRINLVEL